MFVEDRLNLSLSAISRYLRQHLGIEELPTFTSVDLLQFLKAKPVEFVFDDNAGAVGWLNFDGCIVPKNWCFLPLVYRIVRAVGNVEAIGFTLPFESGVNFYLDEFAAAQENRATYDVFGLIPFFNGTQFTYYSSAGGGNLVNLEMYGLAVPCGVDNGQVGEIDW